MNISFFYLVSLDEITNAFALRFSIKYQLFLLNTFVLVAAPLENVGIAMRYHHPNRTRTYDLTPLPRLVP